jgi:hypothetical protein
MRSFVRWAAIAVHIGLSAACDNPMMPVLVEPVDAESPRGCYEAMTCSASDSVAARIPEALRCAPLRVRVQCG